LTATWGEVRPAGAINILRSCRKSRWPQAVRPAWMDIWAGSYVRAIRYIMNLSRKPEAGGRICQTNHPRQSRKIWRMGRTDVSDILIVPADD